MKVRSGRDTMLVAGVPHSRGTPVHFEDMEDGGYCEFEGDTVTELHTSHKAFVRIHELMHARHTSHRRFKRNFSKFMPESAAQLLEDVRIHLMHWPWKPGKTPKSVKDATIEYMRADATARNEALAEDPTQRGQWPDFATRLRGAAVLGALTGDFLTMAHRLDFAPGQLRLAKTVLHLLAMRSGRGEAKAAKLIAAAFFPDMPPPPKGRGGGTGVNRDPSGDDLLPQSGFNQPNMEVIELPLTEHVKGATVGTRKATMGSRMYRSALRRPILPQRLFVRRTPQEPGGTILIDASGSMGDFSYIEKWAKRAPFGTIAYYAGDGGSEGWLYVYAREGRCAKNLVEPNCRGNTVDGPAMTWLMNQPGPRTMVTDRGFCDAQDSDAQVARLAQLEGCGEIKVVNYAGSDAPIEDDENDEEDGAF